MKIRNLLLITGSVFCLGALNAQTTDLLISEYCEWNHKATDPQTFNHYIEVYNGTGADVDMTKYQLWRAMNGQGWNFDGVVDVDPLTLRGTLANGATYVIARPYADGITIEADTAQTWSFLNISGDDAVGLAKDDGSGTFVLIDVVGEPDNDPGSAWAVGDSATATMNHTMVRKSSVCSPTTDWAASAGTSASNSQWIVLAENDISNINMHTCDCYTDVVIEKPYSLDNIYPVPNNGQFTYKASASREMHVLDITGRTICSFKVSSGNNQISLPLNAGLYFVVTDNYKNAIKLIVE